jgi:hypothetical protein
VATATKKGRLGSGIARYASAPSLVRCGDLASRDQAEHAERWLDEGRGFSGKAVNQ